MLTDAAAVGADTLVHISDEGVRNEKNSFYIDSTHIQKLLSAAIKKYEANVVLCGKQAADTNSGSTGPGVAEILDAACVTLVSEVKYLLMERTLAMRPSNTWNRESISRWNKCICF